MGYLLDPETNLFFSDVLDISKHDPVHCFVARWGGERSSVLKVPLVSRRNKPGQVEGTVHLSFLASTPDLFEQLHHPLQGTIIIFRYLSVRGIKFLLFVINSACLPHREWTKQRSHPVSPRPRGYSCIYCCNGLDEARGRKKLFTWSFDWPSYLQSISIAVDGMLRSELIIFSPVKVKGVKVVNIVVESRSRYEHSVFVTSTCWDVHYENRQVNKAHNERTSTDMCLAQSTAKIISSGTSTLELSRQEKANGRRGWEVKQ